jgi:glycosyl hydrolase group 75 (putative chitosanase)
VGRIRLRTWRRLVLVVFAALFTAIVYRWISLERLQGIAPAEIPSTPTPQPTATRPPVITGKLDTARLFNGITFHSTVETIPGADASTERAQQDSYVLDLRLHARVPSPNKTIDELAKVSPNLAALLPGLTSMFQGDPISPLYAQLYDTKVRMLRENLSRLDTLLSRHNFFDCQTILQLQHAQTHRKALLLQAEMDVDADGSDGDRMPAGTGAPANFKPATSYRWPKKTSAPNPYLAATEEALKRAESEYSLATTPPNRKRDLRNTISQLRAEVGTLTKFSFLIGATDPFIVVPGSFTHAREPVKVGDLAVVVFGEAIYPAIVGDVGPNDKVGEASLRIAKEINALSTPYNRPVSDLKVTYLIFPGTADKTIGPPDLDKLQAQCEALIKEIGGAKVPLHHWENIIPASPTPTPTSTPSPASSPNGTPSPLSTTSSTPSPVPSATFAFPISSPAGRVHLTPSPVPTSSPAATRGAVRKRKP